MRIAIVSIFPPRKTVHAETGGVAYYTHFLAHNIPVGTEDELTVLCNKLGGRTEEYRDGNIRVIRCFDKAPRFIFQIARQLLRLRPDCLHIQQELSLYGNVLTAWLLQFLVRAAKLGGIRTVLTLHAAVPLKAVDADFVRGNFSRAPPWLVRFALARIYRPLCRTADRLIVHEHFFRRVLVSDYCAHPDAISVIPIGVQKSACAPRHEARAKLALSERHRVVLFMGYATGYKGIDLLLEGFAHYAKSHPDAYLLMAAGKHPKLAEDPRYLGEYVRLQDKAAALIPAEQYTWHGFIAEDDFRFFFGACDVVVFPYTVAMSSSGPMALALGFDRPILASAALIELLPTHDLAFAQEPAALAAKLQAFFQSPGGYQQSASQMLRDRSWARVGVETKSVYCADGRTADQSTAL